MTFFWLISTTYRRQSLTDYYWHTPRLQTSASEKIVLNSWIEKILLLLLLLLQAITAWIRPLFYGMGSVQIPKRRRKWTKDAERRRNTANNVVIMKNEKFKQISQQNIYFSRKTYIWWPEVATVECLLAAFVISPSVVVFRWPSFDHIQLACISPFYHTKNT